MRQLTRTCLCAAALLMSKSAWAQTLSESILLAISNHPQVYRQELLLDFEQEQLAQVESNFLPQVSMALGIGREDSNNSLSRALVGSSVEMERREASINLRQMLFDGFETHWRHEGQGHFIEAAKYLYQSALEETAVEAAQYHYALAKAEKVLAYSLENFNFHEEVAERIEARVQSGKDDRAKIAQVQARRALAVTNLESARAALANAKAAYAYFVGEMPSGGFDLTDTGVALPADLTGFLESVKQTNPEYLAAQARLSATQDLARASRSSNLPSLSLESGATWNANIDGVRGRNNDAFAMLRVSYDLYQGGAKRSAQRLADIEREQQRYVLLDLERDLKERSAQVWYEFDSAFTQSEYVESYVAAAELTRQAYQKQFKIGQRSLINLLDAENELLSAQLLREDVLEKIALNRLRILALTGSILDTLALPVE